MSDFPRLRAYAMCVLCGIADKAETALCCDRCFVKHGVDIVGKNPWAEARFKAAEEFLAFGLLADPCGYVRKVQRLARERRAPLIECVAEAVT